MYLNFQEFQNAYLAPSYFSGWHYFDIGLICMLYNKACSMRINGSSLWSFHSHLIFMVFFRVYKFFAEILCS